MRGSGKFFGLASPVSGKTGSCRRREKLAGESKREEAEGFSVRQTGFRGKLAVAGASSIVGESTGVERVNLGR